MKIERKIRNKVNCGNIEIEVNGGGLKMTSGWKKTDTLRVCIVRYLHSSFTLIILQY